MVTERAAALALGATGRVIGEDSGLNLADDNQEVADNIFERLGPGVSAHVAVNQHGEHFARGKGPNGEEIKVAEKGPNAGREDYVDQKTGKRVYNATNHAVMYGRTPDGKKYLYDPLHRPPYMTEDHPDFEDHAKNLIAKNKDGDYYAKFTRFIGD